MSLLDIFNTDAGRQALGLMAAGGPVTDPNQTGYGQRMQTAVGSFDAWKQKKIENEQNAMKFQILQARQMQEMQEAQQQQQLRETQAKENARIQAIVAGAGRVSPGMGGTAAIESALPEGMRIPAQPALQQPGKIYFRALMQQGVPFETLKNLAASENLGREEVARVQEIEGPNGTKLLQGFDKFGGSVGQGAAGYLAPQLVNLADRQMFVKPSAGMSLPMGQSPDSKASNAVAWANNALANRKFAFDQTGGPDSGGSTQVGLNKQFGKPQAGYRWKADGSLEFIPGGPADQKAQLKTSGEGTVDSVVADLRDKYEQLNTGGGIVNDKSSALSNIPARLGSSGVGQFLGGTVGTTNQTSRDNIAMTRPLLLQAIMKATGMSAKQMDSNAELKLYLATATDPTKGYQANAEALNRIEKLYGSGQQSVSKPAQTASPSTTPPAPMKGQLKGGYKFKGGNPADQANWEKQ